jgi:heptosyltransferase-2
VNLCDLIVTGDTLALHVAVALDKMVVALFGPTSAAEIDLYGRGVKLVSDAPCVGCYRTECDVLPTCMERISAQQVHGAILGLLAGNGHQGQAHVGSGVPFE